MVSEAPTRRTVTRHEFPIHAPGAVSNYSLKFIPSEIWEAARERADREGVSIRWVLLVCLKQFAEGSLRIISR